MSESEIPAVRIELLLLGIVGTALLSLYPPIGSLIVLAHISDQLTVSGLMITLGGFAITVWQLRLTNESSLASSKAVNALELRLKTFEDAQMCASCLSIAKEIERLHVIAALQKTAQSHVFLPERYHVLRHALIELRERVKLSSPQQSIVQRCIVKLQSAEKSVPHAINHGGTKFPNLQPVQSATQAVSGLLTLISVKLNKKVVREHDKR